MFWSIDRLGRSTAAVTAALADLEAAGVAILSRMPRTRRTAADAGGIHRAAEAWGHFQGFSETPGPAIDLDQSSVAVERSQRAFVGGSLSTADRECLPYRSRL
jgi:hypothetical protein